MSPTDTPRVSVLVATKNRPDDLARLIPTLLAQDETRFELIIVDQSTDQRTANVVHRFGDARIEYAHQAVCGKSKALNLGLGKSRSDLIAFTDDDCTVPSNWLSRGMQCIERIGAGLLFGSLDAVHHDPMTQYVPAIRFSRERVIADGGWRTHGLLGLGANMMVRRELFEKTGGFFEELGTGGRLKSGEECELAFRALRSGFSVVQSPQPAVLHWGVRTVSDGIAKRLVTDGFFGMGAGYGKHLARCDMRAASVVLQDSSRWSLELALAMIRLRRPFHVRRISSYWKGIVAGLATGSAPPSIPS